MRKSSRAMKELVGARQISDQRIANVALYDVAMAQTVEGVRP